MEGKEDVVRIAQVSPLFERVPPKLYGGTERVVSNLTEELVRQGHEVTLFASGDSVTSAELVPGCPEALRLSGCVDGMAPHVALLEEVSRRGHRFDIIHFHCDYLHFPFSRRHGYAHVTTLHGRLNIPELRGIYQEYPEMPVISISDAQRQPLPWANWHATVHHGLPLDLLEPGDGAGGYLAFLGRISKEKRVDRAITIARRTGLPLKIAAKIDRADQDYFDEEIAPLFDDPLVEYIGEINEAQKQAFLGQARALLFPIDWPEPFGLVMIEAMACGTPVIAWRCGSVPEVIDQGMTGFVVENIDEAVEAVECAGHLDRRVIREVFETRFSVARMARDYLRVYETILETRKGSQNGALIRHRRPIAKRARQERSLLPE